MSRIRRSWRWVLPGMGVMVMLGVIVSSGGLAGASHFRGGNIYVGVVSLVSGQDSLVSVSNLAKTTQHVTVTIRDEDGQALTQESPSIGPGATAFFGTTGNVPAGVSLRALIKDQDGDAGDLVASLQVLDGTNGPTELFVGPHNPFTGTARTASVHLVDGDGLRANVANLGSSPADFRVRVIDGTSNTIFSEMISNVAPGEIGSMSWPAGGTQDWRLVVRGPKGTRFIASAEYYAVSTGRTRGVVPLVPVGTD